MNFGVPQPISKVMSHRINQLMCHPEGYSFLLVPCKYEQNESKTAQKNATKRKPLTCFPFCCADLDSLKLNISPPTEHSRHTPHLALPPQNWPFGCMIRTPFVVRPSISTLSCHFVAFSWNQTDNLVSSTLEKNCNGQSSTEKRKEKNRAAFLTVWRPIHLKVWLSMHASKACGPTNWNSDHILLFCTYCTQAFFYCESWERMVNQISQHTYWMRWRPANRLQIS